MTRALSPAQCRVLRDAPDNWREVPSAIRATVRALARRQCVELRTVPDFPCVREEYRISTECGAQRAYSRTDEPCNSERMQALHAGALKP